MKSSAILLKTSIVLAAVAVRAMSTPATLPPRGSARAWYGSRRCADAFTQSDKTLPGLDLVVPEDGADAEPRPTRYNGAPSQDFWVIRRHPETGAYHRDLLRWGLIPYWTKEAKGGRKPINARCETVARLPSFRAAYAKRRCIVPIDNFFEWRKTTPPKQPFAIGMADGSAVRAGRHLGELERPGERRIYPHFLHSDLHGQ